MIVQAATDNFWILMNKNHFNTLVESGKNMSKPVLLKDIAGLLPIISILDIMCS